MDVNFTEHPADPEAPDKLPSGEALAGWSTRLMAGAPFV